MQRSERPPTALSRDYSQTAQRTELFAVFRDIYTARLELQHSSLSGKTLHYSTCNEIKLAVDRDVRISIITRRRVRRFISGGSRPCLILPISSKSVRPAVGACKFVSNILDEISFVGIVRASSMPLIQPRAATALSPPPTCCAAPTNCSKRPRIAKPNRANARDEPAASPGTRAHHSNVCPVRIHQRIPDEPRQALSPRLHPMGGCQPAS
jgi:hypothetical protein